MSLYENIFLIKSLLLDLVAMNSVVEKSFQDLTEEEDEPGVLNRKIYNSFCCFETAGYFDSLYKEYTGINAESQRVYTFTPLPNHVYEMYISLRAEDHALIVITTDDRVHILNTYGGIPAMFYTILTMEDFNIYSRNMESNTNIMDNLWLITGGIPIEQRYWKNYSFQWYDILDLGEHNGEIIISKEFLKGDIDRLVNLLEHEEDREYMKTVKTLIR